MVNYDINYKSDNNIIVLLQWELQTVIIKIYIFCDKKKSKYYLQIDTILLENYSFFCVYWKYFIKHWKYFAWKVKKKKKTLTVKTHFLCINWHFTKYILHVSDINNTFYVLK